MKIALTIIWRGKKILTESAENSAFNMLPEIENMSIKISSAIQRTLTKLDITEKRILAWEPEQIENYKKTHSVLILRLDVDDSPLAQVEIAKTYIHTLDKAFEKASFEMERSIDQLLRGMETDQRVRFTDDKREFDEKKWLSRK